MLSLKLTSEDFCTHSQECIGRGTNKLFEMHSKNTSVITKPVITFSFEPLLLCFCFCDIWICIAHGDLLSHSSLFVHPFLGCCPAGLEKGGMVGNVISFW